MSIKEIIDTAQLIDEKSTSQFYRSMFQSTIYEKEYGDLTDDGVKLQKLALDEHMNGNHANHLKDAWFESAHSGSWCPDDTHPEFANYRDTDGAVAMIMNCFNNRIMYGTTSTDNKVIMTSPCIFITSDYVLTNEALIYTYSLAPNNI